MNVTLLNETTSELRKINNLLVRATSAPHKSTAEINTCIERINQLLVELREQEMAIPVSKEEEDRIQSIVDEHIRSKETDERESDMNNQKTNDLKTAVENMAEACETTSKACANGARRRVGGDVESDLLAVQSEVFNTCKHELLSILESAPVLPEKLTEEQLRTICEAYHPEYDILSHLDRLNIEANCHKWYRAIAHVINHQDSDTGREKRKPAGLYWVRYNGEWTVAELGENGVWLMPGIDEDFYEDEFEAIGIRLQPTHQD